MPSFNAFALLRANNVALVVFTRGAKFHKNANRTGTTGYWVCSEEKLQKVNTVIVYLRNKNKTNNVFKADVSGFTPSGKRQLISFTNCRSKGITDLNWYEFTNPSSNPVKYLGI